MQLNWTQEETDTLYKLWCIEGKSSTFIAKELNRTRSSVVARANRLWPEYKRMNYFSSKNINFVKKDSSLEKGNDFTLTGCCYPFGDIRNKNHKYCNKEKAVGQVYCDEHCRVCFKNWDSDKKFNSDKVANYFIRRESF